MRDEKYLELLAEKYPTEQAVCREIINLKAILSLPKGTEHFMSDLHGEYEAFCHILNNCSGVIREKVDLLFEDTLSDLDREEICTLIVILILLYMDQFIQNIGIFLRHRFSYF